jgi:hypothetical protein
MNAAQEAQVPGGEAAALKHFSLESQILYPILLLRLFQDEELPADVALSTKVENESTSRIGSFLPMHDTGQRP